jgi:hypothetical protein
MSNRNKIVRVTSNTICRICGRTIPKGTRAFKTMTSAGSRYECLTCHNSNSEIVVYCPYRTRNWGPKRRGVSK